MQVCPNCHHQNRIGTVFCEQCGGSLIGDAPLATKNFGHRAPESWRTNTGELGSDVFKAGTMLRLEVEGAEPIMLRSKKEMVFGRRDPATGTMPDIDLTPFAGYRMGVSRKHAVLRQGENNRLELWDLGSSNGTYLNGVRLVAHRPNRIHDGDEIRLGQMVMRLYFHRGDENTSDDGKSVNQGNTQNNNTRI
jgi:hypothetical protein